MQIHCAPVPSYKHWNHSLVIVISFIFHHKNVHAVGLLYFAKKKRYNTTVVPEENMKLRLANRVQEPLNANFVHNMLFHQGAENQEKLNC